MFSHDVIKLLTFLQIDTAVGFEACFKFNIGFEQRGQARALAQSLRFISLIGVQSSYFTDMMTERSEVLVSL